MLDFTFNGKKASDYGIRLQEAISFSAAVPVVQAVHVPGRNGDLHIFDGSFENRTASAKCFVLADNAADAMAAVNSFLFEGFSGGYKPLIPSDDEGHYWEAIVTNAGEIQTRLSKLNPFTIEWTCKPYRIDVESGDAVL